jgi:hypothetical protein
VFCIENKTEVMECFKKVKMSKWQKMIINGGEYINQEFKKYLLNVGNSSWD